jgi:hypothetical protein
MGIAMVLNKYQSWMFHLQELPVIALVTTGRTGSDFLQSLLDSHPQVATFNGHFLPYTEFFSTSKVIANNNGRAEDLADEFIGYYLYKLVSRYDIQEGKDCLGVNSNESFEISTLEFKNNILGFLEGVKLTTRNFLISVYGAYNLCIGQKIEDLRILFHHPHLDYELRLFLNDFPSTRLIFSTRDPRANFFSHVDHFRRYYKTHDNEAHIYYCLKMALEDSELSDEYLLDYTAARLEDFPREDKVRKLATWLGIDYNESMLRSTWVGLDWHGDKVSIKKFSATGWSQTRTENGWQKGLGWNEKLVFNYILNDRLKWYGYPVRPANKADPIIIAILILLPFKSERRLMAPARVFEILSSKDYEMYLQFILTFPYMFKRIVLCYRYYWRTLLKIPFRRNWID